MAIFVTIELPQNCMSQSLIANTVVMIRPAAFGFNPEAAVSNAFQSKISGLSPDEIQEIALLEFDNFVHVLRSNGIQVMVFDDTIEPYTPDAIFPNNWFSTCIHSEKIYTYPMGVSIRSNERRDDIIQNLALTTGWTADHSLIAYESQGLALEGTGSLVLDHQNKLAYAALSPRTDEVVLNSWCNMAGFEPVAFDAYGDDGTRIYHTNVLMTMGDDYVVIAMDTITDQSQKNTLIQKFENTGKAIIEISIAQMNAYAGNMMQLRNDQGQKCLVMSSSAHRSLTKDQIHRITEVHNNRIIAVPINVVETIGGGSARCMIAEVFGQ